MTIQRMVFLLRMFALLATVLAVDGFGQATGQSTLSLQIRPECGLLGVVYEMGPDAGEGVVRFLYAARTGTSGGQLEMLLPEGAGAARITASLSGPAEARPAFLLEAGQPAVAAVLLPRRHTTREGSAGEIRWRWLTEAQPVESRPVLTIRCP